MSQNHLRQIAFMFSRDLVFTFLTIYVTIAIKLLIPERKQKMCITNTYSHIKDARSVSLYTYNR